MVFFVYLFIVFQGWVVDCIDGVFVGVCCMVDVLLDLLLIEVCVVGILKVGCVDDWLVVFLEVVEMLNGLWVVVVEVIMVDLMLLFVINICVVSFGILLMVVEWYFDVVVFWIDVYGDFNILEMIELGYFGGMVFVVVCGLWDSGYGVGFDFCQVVVVGGCDIDLVEVELLLDVGVMVFSFVDSIFECVFEFVVGWFVWVYVDWDVFEFGFIFVVYCVGDGLFLYQIVVIFVVFFWMSVCGVELVEFEVGDVDVLECVSVEFIIEMVQYFLY